MVVSPMHMDNFTSVKSLRERKLTAPNCATEPISWKKYVNVYCEKTVKLAYTYLPNPSARAGYDTRSIFMWSLTVLNSEISFS